MEVRITLPRETYRQDAFHLLGLKLREWGLIPENVDPEVTVAQEISTAVWRWSRHDITPEALSRLTYDDGSVRLSPSTAHRMLGALEDAGYLVRKVRP